MFMANQVVSLSYTSPIRTLSFRHRRHDDAEARFRLLSRLQTTLELHRLLQLYFEELKELVGLQGLRWQSPEPGVQFEFGRLEQTCSTHQLAADGVCLGELTISRHAVLLKDEALLNEMLALLAHPLRNAISYQKALAAAKQDELTGLPNRAAFNEAISREVEMSHRHGVPLTVLFLDVDRFKEINDRHGHQAGDLALQRVAAAMTGAMRQSDQLFRYGGDEFVMLLTRTGLEGARVVAERMQKAVAGCDLQPDGEQVPIRISFGLAVCGEGDAPESLLRRADQALLAAKQQRSD